MPPVCSIVIPSFNGRRLLEPCLSSIERHRPEEIDLEVIVVDDASTDDTIAWIRDRHPSVRVVQLERNGGFCAAANAGIAATKGEFVQLLNNDAEVTAHWLEAGLGPFVDPKVGSVAPLVLVRTDPSRVDSAGDSYAVIGWPSKRGHGRDAAEWTKRNPQAVFGASGSSAFYRSEALRITGPFDPIFGSYYEDIDLAFRLCWAGYTCIFAPACRVLHDISASYDHARPDLQRRMARNAELIFWTRVPLGWLAVAVIPHLVFSALQAVWRLTRNRLGPFVHGRLDAWKILTRELVVRRSLNHALARRAVARPTFPFVVVPLGEVRDHLTRPRETTSLAHRRAGRRRDREIAKFKSTCVDSSISKV